MTPAFEARIADLDAVVAACAGRGPFGTGVVRDASNRSNREWPWWGVQIEHTQVEGSVNRRATATVTLRSTESEGPGSFDAQWRAQVWQGSGTDTFCEDGAQALEWTLPTPEMLQDLMEALMSKAKAVIPGWQGT